MYYYYYKAKDILYFYNFLQILGENQIQHCVGPSLNILLVPLPTCCSGFEPIGFWRAARLCKWDLLKINIIHIHATEGTCP